MKHDYNLLICIFNQLFENSENTILLLGGDEPIYLPANEQHTKHRIIFARGFFASALHEIAHWCIAGKNRRLLEDYGYWYQPCGRDEKTQAEFEKVELKPQAIEWILSTSCHFPFQVSCDNINANFEPDRKAFKEKIRKQIVVYLREGVPERAKILSETLCRYYQRPYITEQDFLQ